MLNISENNIQEQIDLTQYKSIQQVGRKIYYKKFNRIMKYAFAFVILFLFLPWTQTIHSSGFVTTLRPEQRPQTIQSAIAGKIEKWFVREGDFVQKGDTILFISEVKDDYFDPNLLERTESQLKAKTLSVESYEEKVKALDKQIVALSRERILKLEQTRNKLLQAKLKVKTDSIDFEASKTMLSIANKQYERTLSLQKDGLKSTADLEEKRLKQQETQAKIVSQENKLLASKNELINAEIELSSIEAAYIDKISKAMSEKYSALSSQYDTEAQVNKLQNQFTNYEIRSGMRYIAAPQSGYINKALQSGIGETFKEGAQIVSIMPSDIEFGVETYVSPIDLPLLHVGEEVRIFFDGWPAIVFRGWPNVSYGTYGGKIVAIETYISSNGKYRILIAPDNTDNPWPKAIRAGSGAQTMAMLNDVPIFYEIWRKINAFPPDFYQPASNEKNKK